MIVTNNTSFRIHAYAFLQEYEESHGYGGDRQIKSGETKEISGQWMDHGGYKGRPEVPGHVVLHEDPKGDSAFFIARHKTVEYQNDDGGVVVCVVIRHQFDEPPAKVKSFWYREAVLMVSEDGTPPCEDPENLICHRCEEEMHASEFIPNTTCCFGCHEMTLMQETGYGVVTHEGTGLLGLNGSVYKVN